jgi:membrane-associated protein
VLSGRYALDDLVRWGGYVVLVAIVFIETGLLVGFFLPATHAHHGRPGGGDRRAEHLVAERAARRCRHRGRQRGVRHRLAAGPRLFTRPKSLLFNPRHIERTRAFYARHGAKTIVIARFVPIVRTFAPVVAGVGQMEYRRFLFYNVAGGVGWVTSMTWAGYLLGQTVPNISEHIHVVVIIVILLSLIPIVVELVRERRRHSA